MHAMYRSGDGSVDGYLARPTKPGPWAAVVIGHEWWGLDDHFRRLANRLAKEAYVCLVPDMYHGFVTDDPFQAAQRKASLDLDAAARSMVDAVPYLRSLPFVRHDRIAVMGFCMGGGIALLAACRSTEWRAAVIYFQSMFPDPEELQHISCPVLGHYGTKDPFTPPSEANRFKDHLERLGKQVQIYFYEGATHAFVNDMHPEYYNAEAAEASWVRTLSFLQEHLA